MQKNPAPSHGTHGLERIQFRRKPNALQFFAWSHFRTEPRFPISGKCSPVLSRVRRRRGAEVMRDDRSAFHFDGIWTRPGFLRLGAPSRAPNVRSDRYLPSWETL